MAAVFPDQFTLRQLSPCIRGRAALAQADPRSGNSALPLCPPKHDSAKIFKKLHVFDMEQSDNTFFDIFCIQKRGGA
jgi:hypothetical protein